MGEPFFVVSTGRSGTMSLALALNQHPLLCVMHEPYRFMVQQAYLHVKARGEGLQRLETGMREWFEMAIPRPAVQRVGIVDQKMVQFIEEGHAAFPMAQWIWLVRDGRDVVASGYGRGWYNAVEAEDPEHIWSAFRLAGDVAGDVEAERWAAMGPFERCCWYWAWIQARIREGLAALGEAGGLWRLVRLEDVNEAVLGELQCWLGVDVLPMPMLMSNESPEGQAQSWQTWGPELRETFTAWCGAEMGRVYPGWGWS